MIVNVLLHAVLQQNYRLQLWNCAFGSFLEEVRALFPRLPGLVLGFGSSLHSLILMRSIWHNRTSINSNIMKSFTSQRPNLSVRACRSLQRSAAHAVPRQKELRPSALGQDTLNSRRNVIALALLASFTLGSGPYPYLFWRQASYVLWGFSIEWRLVWTYVFILPRMEVVSFMRLLCSFESPTLDRLAESARPGA